MDNRTAFGAALTQALLPPDLQAALARAGGGPLLLLDDALARAPWELAVIDGQGLDDRFVASVPASRHWRCPTAASPTTARVATAPTPCRSRA